MADRVEEVMALIGSLSDVERATVRARLVSMVDAEPTAKSLSNSVRKKKKRPHCESTAVVAFGKYRGGRRFKCKSCSKYFTAMTGAPVSSVQMTEKMRLFAAQMAKGGVSLRQSAADLGVSLPTAFRWRHKVLQGYSLHPSRKLTGIAEADETFFRYSEKGDKTVRHRRKAHKRGGATKGAGVSDDLVPVVVGCDRRGELILGVAGRGRVSQQDIEHVLGKRIDPEATLCSDSHSSFRAFANAHDMKYKPINISKGQRVIKKVYHIQNVNNAHTRMKGWMVRFDGVATKYLDNYAGWFGLMEEIKQYDDREVKFVERSMMQRCRPRN